MRDSLDAHSKENVSKAAETEGNVEFLKQKRNFHTFESCSISDVKMNLKNNLTLQNLKNKNKKDL